MSRPGLFLSLVLAAGTASAVPPAPMPTLSVTVQGRVSHAGTFELPVASRLNDVLHQAQPDADAFVIGARLLRVSAQSPQLRLKAGLAYDLQALQSGTNGDLASTAGSLLARLRALPVTGRITPQSMEMRWLDIHQEAARPLENGDRIVFPARPSTIRVEGAVVVPCSLAHVPLQDAPDYLTACRPAAGADRDWIYAVQPDGQVLKLGIAAWNRSPPQPLAPGAWLYVPLDENGTAVLDPDFNREFAQFLATQSIPAGEAGP